MLSSAKEKRTPEDNAAREFVKSRYKYFDRETQFDDVAIYCPGLPTQPWNVHSSGRLLFLLLLSTYFVYQKRGKYIVLVAIFNPNHPHSACVGFDAGCDLT